VYGLKRIPYGKTTPVACKPTAIAKLK
jgi:hypothetical protein